MRDILLRLRSDAGQLTFAILIQEREAAACEIERLRDKQELHLPVVTGRSLCQPKVNDKPSAERPPEAPTLRPSALLRLKDVCALLGMSRSTVYNRISEGSFPRPARVGIRSVRWRAEDLSAWRKSLKG
jgi:prophage regulatory protein